MDLETYEQFVGSLPSRSIALAGMTVHIYTGAQLDDAQLGYAVDPNGDSLVGEQEGDWRAGWLVIGHEDLTGDPILVDWERGELPVYVAPHGEGTWQPVLIADSLDGFSAALRAVAAIAHGRETPVPYDENPVAAAECERALEQIRRTNGEADLAFWKGWLTAWKSS